MRVLSLFYWKLTIKENPMVFVVIITLRDRILNDGLQYKDKTA